MQLEKEGGSARSDNCSRGLSPKESTFWNHEKDILPLEKGIRKQGKKTQLLLPKSTPLQFQKLHFRRRRRRRHLPWPPLSLLPLLKVKTVKERQKNGETTVGRTEHRELLETALASAL